MPTHTGLAFGPGNLWRDSARLRWGPEPFTASYNYSDPGWLVEELEVARRLNLRVILNMTGGRHERYKTNDKFDLTKWRARMDQYDTPEIKAAVAAGVADGTIIMNSVMDEPNVKSWGGVVTKAMLDDMASYVKNMFPTLPVGVALRWDWKGEDRFKVMDAFITMYAWNKGDINAYREGALALARRDRNGGGVCYNVLDGGEYSNKTKASHRRARHLLTRLPDDPGADPGVGPGARTAWMCNVGVGIRSKLYDATGKPAAFKDIAEQLAPNNWPGFRRDPAGGIDYQLRKQSVGRR